MTFRHDVLATDGDTSWFVRDRFGMFIHWGLYALPARHEWIRHKEKIGTEDYDRKYFSRFDPDLYDPKLWADAAAGAGMKYYVVTTKHHEGFCLWDSKLTDYKATNTPAKRDLLRPLVEAMRGKGLRTGLYHSLIDWHHPDYLIDTCNGPYREAPERDKLNEGRDQNRYIDYLHGQVRELLTGYGDVDVLWFDFSFPRPDGSGKGREAWKSEKLLELIRKLAPKIILNERLDLPHGWDVKTPEQFNPLQWPTHEGRKVVWEACQTLSGSWGYHRDESSWRSSEELIRTLIHSVARGGNLRLNVGPTGRGEIDDRALSRLSDIGRWMKRHGRSIYGCTQIPDGFPAPPSGCEYTWNPETNRLYIHVLEWPYKLIALPGLNGRVEYAQLLHDASELSTKGLADWQKNHWGGTVGGPDTLFINLPADKPAGVAVPVIECWLKP